MTLGGESLAFAYVLGGHRGRARIYPDTSNKTSPWVPIEAAAARNRPFLVHVRKCFLAIDVDEKIAAARALEAELFERDVRPVILPSGGDNRWHLFCRIEDPELMAWAKERAHVYGLHHRDAIRPPMMPHRTGAQPLIENWDDVLEALAPARPRRDLTAKAQSLLREGDPPGRYESRSEVVQAITLDAVKAGWGRLELLEKLMDPSNLGGEKVREVRSPEQSVHHGWRKALCHYFVNETWDECERIWGAAEASRWSGIAGATDRRVLHAHLLPSLKAGSVNYRMSTRACADLSGIKHQTVSRAHRRLTKAGWLKSEPRVSKRSISRWTLTVPPEAPKDSPKAVPLLPIEVLDVFSPPGIGPNALRLWEALSATERPPADLAHELHLHPTTVRKRLRHLESFELATKTQAGWIRCEGDLTEVARALGTDGMMDRRREEHRRARQAMADRRGLANERVDPETGEMTPLRELTA
jgi:hypothetical protein